MQRPVPGAVPDPHAGPAGRVSCSGRALPTPDRTAYDREWSGDVRFAGGCSVTLLGLLLAVDAAAGRLTWLRVLLWAAIAAVLCAVLVPPRVCAGTGWLSSRGLLRRTTVRTDLLVSVRWSDGVAERLLLRDAHGCRVELDPRVFVANPALWHRLDEDARTCMKRGTLLCGATALRQLGDRIDRRTARTVFEVSGLE
ncbi:hypothetical protein OH809_36785 [Streptomyces sp. NBC_00873]|uniref:hypothetical protein n=1 Tax=unclassified Streptomyces TaxID=2593676 RepID=UPI00386612C1|nr:hypothetical protein OH809_36785 [Streptomyces sp. NBC_00873]WTA42377.1 hypothetical protein OH821_06925 [Streptomyces sp. NBC_00842]